MPSQQKASKPVTKSNMLYLIAGMIKIVIALLLLVIMEKLILAHVKNLKTVAGEFAIALFAWTNMKIAKNLMHVTVYDL